MTASEFFLSYFRDKAPSCSTEKVLPILSQTRWDEPHSGYDWNNIGVLSLIEAEQCADDLSVREACLELAIEAFQNGESDYPLCTLHLALIHYLLGEFNLSTQAALVNYVKNLQLSFCEADLDQPGLIYMPVAWEKQNDSLYQHWINLTNVNEQVIHLSSTLLSYSQLFIYNSTGLRYLHLDADTNSMSALARRKLGIGKIVNHCWEGLYQLHYAQKLSPADLSTVQSLHIAYRSVQQTDSADYWLKLGQQLVEKKNDLPSKAWTSLSSNTAYTYVPFDEEISLAVEPDFQSIVTSILLGQGDWFEKEMEFWRQWIQSGMTVIDVGSNAGVYTFSAACRVGNTGKVIAIEPFSKCVALLHETCRVNQINWVKVYKAAASNSAGMARLALHRASELNELIIDSNASNMAGTFEEVACITLDSLLEKENLTRVDILKIDAEGHEVAVLEGSQGLIKEFQPFILYENIAGSKGSNIEVAQYLIQLGYQLCHYKPFLQKIIPIDNLESVSNELNLIAIPKN
jgi:FkbM family methyltransferase